MKIKTIEMAETQKGIYFDCQIEQTSSYHISATVLLKNANEQCLQNAIKILVHEQEALRSGFEIKDGVPVMNVYDKPDYEIKKMDLSNEENQKLIIEEVTREMLGTPFVLSRASLFRAALLKMAPDSHILILCCHHLISDGISMGILVDKLLQYHQCLSEGKTIEISTDSGFTDFITKENQKLSLGDYQENKRFWKKKLEGAEALTFQADYTNKPSLAGTGREIRFVIPEDLFHKIELLSMEYEVSLFTFFLAAFQVLMGKYTRTEDLTVSSPFTYRPDYDLEETIGCFVHMLPVRCTINKEDTFADTLSVVQKEFFQAYKNIGYPNNLIMRDNFPAQAPGQPSIYDISFVYDSYEEMRAGNVKAVIMDQDFETFSGNMMVVLNRIPGRNQIKIQYKPELYKKETMEYLGQRYLRLLECISENIGIKNEEIDLFLPGERERMIRDDNQFSYFEYKPGTVMEVLQEKAARFPDRTAFLYGDQSMSYREVNQKANRLGFAIADAAKGEKQVVGIMSDRSPELLVSIYGVLKAGCAYVPIDPAYPDERVRFIIEDASISQVVASYTYADRFPDTVLLHNPEDYKEGEDMTDPPKLPSPHDLAYIEYTSGSTGKPKGVMIEHHSLLNTLLDLERRFPVKEGDVYLLKTTFSFDVSGTEIYGWFMGEGSLAILEADGEKDPEKILDTIVRYRVTHINFVPSMFRIFLQLFDEGKNKEKLHSLKWIFVGGEAVTPDIVSKFNSLHTDISLDNVYGPTECTIWASHYPLKDWSQGQNIPIGTPLNEIRWYIVDEKKELLPVGIPGELCLSGAGLARGYLNREELTKEMFCPNPFFQKGKDPDHYERIYRTGDLVRRLPDNSIEFLGRIDFQVKINGVRLELGEIENAISGMDEITQAVVLAKELPGGASVLCTYYSGREEVEPAKIREYLSEKLPSYMIPSFFVYKKQLPLNGSGKLDQKALRADNSYLNQYSIDYAAPETEMEKLVADIWENVLSVERVGLDEPFFEKGGHSVALMEVHNKLKKILKRDISIVLLFQLPTVRLQAEYLSKEAGDQTVKVEVQREENDRILKKEDIAIIGMSVHVPGADSVEDFWDVLKSGRESIHFYEDEELRELGISEELIHAPNYIKAKGRVNGIESFDPKFFHYTPADVKIMPPQLRLLYKGAWEAFEDAGYYPGSDDSRIGVFVGGSDDFEWYQDTILNEKHYGDRYQAFTFGTNHFLATRLAYKLNIQGPVYTALTGCSTSLVTPHLACQSLISGECDMALAGGVTVELPNEGGYVYEDGMMFSPDGHLHPFDDRAKGTVFSNGMGLIILKRLSDAVKDRDHIYAVIKGSAINNDGNRKVGFAAPSVEGQVDVIRTAYQRSGIDPETVTYVEAHGTGTSLGDPIEVKSLTEAFGGEKKQYCTLGSVKGNVGHADSAAGTVGLEKAALSLFHSYLPATVNYESPNRKIDFTQTPFVVKNYGEKWSTDAGPRRAGVNSFGIGGTNAHMILEEAPTIEGEENNEKSVLMVFSAKSEVSVNQTSERIMKYLSRNDSTSLSDAAWTLQTGRKEFLYRKALVVRNNFKTSSQELIKALEQAPVQVAGKGREEIYFMFPGQGNQYQGMGMRLYKAASDSGPARIYADYIDEVFQHVGTEQEEYWEVIFGDGDATRIHQTKYSQMALFAVEYAMAKTLLKLGIHPKGLIGHSIGEVAAAAVAGVWPLKDAVKIVMARGKIMQMQEPGVMTAVMEDGEKVKGQLVQGTWISLKNTTGKCVVGGRKEAIEAFEQKVRKIGWETIRVKTSHAFHTPMMEQAACEFEKVLANCKMREPSIPILSNLNGTWSKGTELTTPAYWAQHITHPVDFESNLSLLLEEEKGLFLEIGGGRTLCTFAMQHKAKKGGQNFINMMRHPREEKDDLEYFQEKLGSIWSLGVKIDWKAAHKGFVRRKVSLPTYVFDEMNFSIPCSAAKKEEPESVKKVEPETSGVKISGSLTEGVQNAFCSVFGYESIGADENFFDLGGDSLRGVSLAAAIRNGLGVKVDVTDIFNNPTPGGLASLLKDRYKGEENSTQICQAKEREYYPLSSAQSRMYALYQLDQDNTAYNLPSATIIIGKPDKARLDIALKKLADRHESLRTSFEIREGQAVQKIHPSVDMSFLYEKVSDKEVDIPKLIREFIRPFDLEKAPLFRAKFIELEAEKHLMLFDFHHIIADGTSVEVLSRDFSNLYEGDLEPAGIQYKDYAVWQQENLKSGEMDTQKQYWMESLAGELPVLELPTDFDRPRIKSFEGSRIHFRLDKALSERLTGLARKAKATNYMTMLSAWYTLLARYSGQEDIIVGTPTAGRSQDEIRETVGMFVNMLAMRNYPVPNKTFMEFLDEVRENALHAFKNQDYQFDVLAEQLGLKRELNRNALFDVCFDYQNMEFHELEIDGLRFTPYDFDTNTASYDLVLTCQESAQNEIECFIDYSTSLFSRETMERFIAHFIRILETVTENPKIPLEEIDLITEREWEFLRRNVNNTDLSIEDAPVLQAMFEGQAMLNPEKVALITADGTELTYKELNEKANCLAWELIDLGIQKEELVGIMPARDQYLFISILGILKAGAAYVPIDPGFPKERISYMLENGEIHTLICPESYGKKIGFQGKMIDLSKRKKDERGAVNPQTRASISSLACVIYTSGSTGNPKGVMINQESMVNFVMDICNRKIFESEEDRVICVTTVSFDIFGFESITPLCTGNSVYLANESEQLDPVLAGEKIRKYGVSHLLSTVSRIKAFVDNPDFEKALGSLRCILSGGENYPLELLKDLKKRSHAKIFNMYGPTEATIWSTTKDLTNADTINIGSPIANTRAYIINRAKRLQPVGVFGELCLSGKGLARGYWKRPEETEDKFTRIANTDIKVYRTGDRARILPGGEIELLGRLDSQVKIRGYRIELSEIEKMAQHRDEINQAAAIVYEDRNKNKQLALFYNLHTQEPAFREGNAWLKEWLEERLPTYMVPARFILLERMPTLPNGKLNKKALSVMEDGEFKNKEQVQEPLIPTENNVDERDFIKALQKIWQEVLSVETVGIRDNFFDIGGNSLGLILVNNKISRVMGKNIPLMKLFENPTIESLAKDLGLDGKEEEIVFLEHTAEAGKGDIAVIGMACRFPGASDINEFWENIVTGKESITELDDEELLASGIDMEVFQNPSYVKKKGYLEDAEYFDAEFFQYTQKEANGMDPQMRLLHQCAWNALEDGGYDPYRYQGRIGLFAGSSSNVLWMAKGLNSKNNIMDAFETMTLNEKDFLTTKISYKLNLKGPSMNIQTACSTSLTAIHQAAQSLLRGESDVALAGGVSVTYPRKEGYLWHEGMIFSRDGCCKPFSDDATGTVPGNGCGLVLLKPLKKAEKDGDSIYAVIKGSSINNDGMEKIGYTAPAIAGQRRVIAEALKESGISAEEISYLEAHGTGTKLGDPIEVEALRQAFQTDKKNYCALGSVKANIGHLDAAAGVAGFIKSVMSVYNRTIPPLINFQQPNKGLNIEDSPFYFTNKAIVMKDAEVPMNAGVSSFGIGGTNVHVIIGEAPKTGGNQGKEETHTLVFSAKSQKALRESKNRVLTHMGKKAGISLSDAAWTLQTGRGEFEYRSTWTVRGKNINNGSDEVKAFLSEQGSRVLEKVLPLVFQFAEPNQEMGSFQSGMASMPAKNGLCDKYHKELERTNACFQKEGIKTECAAAEYAAWMVLEDLGLMPEGILCPGKKQSVFLQQYQADGRSRKLFVGDRKSDMQTAFPDGYLLVHISPEPENCTHGLEEVYLADKQEKYTDCLMYFHRAAASLWSKGYSVRWEKFMDGKSPKRISLPGYVFDKKYHENDVSLNGLSGQRGEAPLVKESRKDLKQDRLEDITEELKTLWQDILGGARPQREQDFFEAGGHSLNAINLAAKVKERFGVEFMLADIFGHPTLGQMAELVHSGTCQEPNQRIPSVPRKEFYETSSAQKRMYAVSEMLESALPYNLASAYIIRGKLDKERWIQAFQGLTDRHESFRTRFELRNHELVQIVEDEVKADLDFENIREEDAKDAVKSFVQPFDLAKTPLWRGRIFTIRPDYHILAIDMHHIISDQSSIAILLKEFEIFYQGGKLLPLKVQYKDFACWQNKFLESEEAARQIRYWKEELEGDYQISELKSDFVRDPDREKVAGTIRFPFGEKLSGQINRAAKEQGVTPYMLLLASLKLMMWKMTGRKEQIIGTGIAGRKHSDLEQVVGMFVNTLAVRSRIESGMKVCEYLQYIKQKMVNAYDNQDCQFETLLEHLGKKTDPSRTPLFDIMFNYINMGTEELSLNGLVLEPVILEEAGAKFDITCTILEHEGIFTAEIEFDKGLYRKETMKSIGKRLQLAAGEISSKLDEPLYRLSIMTEEEKELLMIRQNHTATDAPLKKSVVGLFEKAVKQFGKKSAIVWNGEEISYDRLNQMADLIARKLKEAGFGYQDRAALILERSPIQIAALLGVMKCGGIYIPIDPEYPEKRIGYILEDSKCSLIVSSKTQYENGKKPGQQMILEDLMFQGELPDTGFVSYPLYGDDTIYIMYTSGSTGNPKGTLLHHKNVIRVVKNTNYIEITPDDHIMQLSNYAFDGSVFDIFGALLNGATLYIVPKEMAVDMEQLPDFIQKNKITVSFMTVALFHVLADWDVTALQSFKTLIVGGDVMSPYHARKAVAFMGPGRLINAYGPTETAVFATCYAIDQVSKDTDSIPIGYPIANTTVYVLDKEMQPVPPGVAGELYIGGAGVGSGYLNQDGLTKEKFLVLPDMQDRVYRTGDKVMYRADGALMFLGRMDFQVKIRGFRVELGEIEKQIQKLPGIKEVIVKDWRDHSGSMYLAAYCMMEEGMYLEAGRCREQLLERLPDYMVPSRWKQLEQFQLTPNGKVDRKALPLIEGECVLLEEKDRPCNTAEQKILSHIQQVLDQPGIGVNDNFFDRGGQSIKAIALVQELSKEGIRIKVNEVFQNPTTRELAQLPEVRAMFGQAEKEMTAQVRRSVSALSGLNPTQTELLTGHMTNRNRFLADLIFSSEMVGHFPLSPIQVLHASLGSDFSGFTDYIHGLLTEQNIKDILWQIIKNNQLLHSAVRGMQEGQWVEYRMDTLEHIITGNLPYMDISMYKKEAKESLIKRLQEELLMKPYVKEGLPWRLCCLKLAEEKHFIIWGFDHTAFDGMSAEIIRSQIERKAVGILFASDSEGGKEDEPQAYDSYVRLLEHGPDHISEDELLKRFSLKKWSRHNASFFDSLSRMPDRTYKRMKIKIPLSEMAGENSWWHSFDFINNLLRAYSGEQEIPLGILDYGRSYGNNGYFNCVGEFLDIIPVLFKKEMTEENIAKKLDVCSSRCINFLSLIFNKKLSQKYQRASELMKPAYIADDGTLNLALFNFQGFVSKREEQAFESADEHGKQNTQLMITVNYDEENLNIELECKYGLNYGMISNIISRYSSVFPVVDIAC